MKTRIFILLFFFAYFSTSAQLSFEKGYFIDNQGNKTEGLIENADWRGNPVSFSYKVNESAKVDKKSIDQVQEFGIYEKVKFIKATVDIDRTSGNTQKLPSKSAPAYTKETLFLDVLLEGPAWFFRYVDGDMTNYLYKKGDGEIVQLLSRDYLDEENYIIKDETYIRQLFSAFKCEGLSSSSYESLKYTKTSLSNFLKKYNQCKGDPGIVYKNTGSKGSLHFSIRPGLTINSVSLVNTLLLVKNAKFKTTPGIRIGIEAEYLLAGMNKKWSLLFEESYQQFSPDTFFSYIQYTVFEYKAFETALGARHYFTNRESSRIFANAKMVASFPINSMIDYENSNDLDLLFNYSFNVGAGVLYKQRFFLEANYWFNRKLTNFRNNFNSLSIILGYRFY